MVNPTVLDAETKGFVDIVVGGDLWMVEKSLRDESTSPALLEAVACWTLDFGWQPSHHFAECMRMSALMNKNQKAEVLACFASADNWRFRKAVAANLAASPEILTALASDQRVEVRSAALYNRSLPVEVIRRAWPGGSSSEFSPMVANPTTPSELLSEALELINSRREFQGGCEEELLAGNLNAPADVLAKLSVSEKRMTRYAVADNPNTPAETLEMMAFRISSSYPHNQFETDALLENPNTPTEALLHLRRLHASQVVSDSHS